MQKSKEVEEVADWFLNCVDLAFKYKTDRKALIEKEGKNFDKLEWVNMNTFEGDEGNEVEGLNYIFFEKDKKEICIMIEEPGSQAQPGSEKECLYIQNIQVPIQLRRKGACKMFINKYMSRNKGSMMFVCVLSDKLKNLLKKLEFTQDNYNWYKNA
jgi:hypothetical protein